MTDDTQAAREALLLCPFCGADPVFPDYDAGDIDFVVVCQKCGAYAAYDDDQSAAISAWNTRFIPAAAALLRAAGWTVEPPPCETCDGTGELYETALMKLCWDCNGTGKQKEEGG